MFNPVDIRRICTLVEISEERWANVRCVDLKEGKVVSHEWFNKTDDVISWARGYNGKGNCFIGRAARKSKGSKDLWPTRLLTIDIDPTGYDKAVGASTAQRMGCKRFSEYIGRLFQGAYVADSGNGILMLWKGTHDISSGGIKAFEEQIRAICEKEKFQVKVDVTHDSSRLIKLIGTISVKGQARLSRFITIPSSKWPGERVCHQLGVVGGQPTKLVPRWELVAQSVHPSRSEADFALALHYQKSGLGADACLEALKHHALGRPERSEDHRRIVEKVYEKRTMVTPFQEIYGTAATYTVWRPSKDMQAYTDYKSKAVNRAGLKTGFKAIDNACGGLRRGEIFTIGARPGVGKTSLLCQIAYKLGKEVPSVNVLFLSTEMSFVDIWDRCISSGGSMLVSELNNLGTDERHSLFTGLNLGVLDSFSPNIETVQQAVEVEKPDVLIFDHVQHIDGGEKLDVLTRFTAGLKDIARKNNIAVLIASQLSRQPKGINYKTGDAIALPPTISDLRGSGKIEEESASILLLHKTGAKIDLETDLIGANLAKNRFGPSVSFDFAFVGRYTQFREV